MTAISEIALGEFIAETDEMIEAIALSLGAFEKGNVDPEAIHTLYRDIHTIKGTAQLFGYGKIGDLAHVMENILEPLRQGKRAPSQQLIDGLFRGLDVIRELMKQVRDKTWGQDFPDYDEVLAHLCLLESKSDQIVQAPRVANVAEVRDAVAESKPTLKSEQPDRAQSDSLRVNVFLLDNLMNLVGELVLIKNQLLQHTASHDDELQMLGQNLNSVTSQLQDEVMKTRMQPISTILTKFHRVTRDLSKDLGKKAELVLEGTETELDKTLIEAVKDPLTHILRNAIDHGLEVPGDRAAAGKPETGTIKISALHEGGEIVVAVSDDGKGLDSKKILKKAVEKGLIAAEAADRMSDREILGLLFEPGFSTAEKVSSVSGRGVGMDVVKTNIERIGGVVDIQSVKGEGTTVRLKIPLTLAIVPALMVRSGNERLAIPQVKLMEVVHFDAGQAAERIESLQGQPVFRLRGDLLPIVNLRTCLGMQADSSGDVNITVLNADGRIFGLVVDEIMDNIDIVVKPLGRFLKKFPVYAGATVLGDGSIALILDVVGLAEYVNLSATGRAERGSNASTTSVSQVSVDASDFLLVDLGDEVSYAIPLPRVHRLEDFDSKIIERSLKREVVRYGSGLLPLLDVSKEISGRVATAADNAAVVVVSKHGRYFGLRVAKILDVVTIDHEIDDTVRDSANVLGTAVHDDGVVVVIDVDALVQAQFFADQQFKVDSGSLQSLSVLVVEDNRFYRDHVRNILLAAGHSVETAVNGKEGLSKLTGQPKRFDLIVSDIEMPEMTGLELARAVREIAAVQSKPMIALTTKSNSEHVAEGLQAGFDRYLEKLNPDLLLKTINDLSQSKR